MKRIFIFLVILSEIVSVSTNLVLAQTSGGGNVTSESTGFDIKGKPTIKLQLPGATIPQSWGIQLKTKDTSATNLDSKE